MNYITVVGRGITLTTYNLFYILQRIIDNSCRNGDYLKSYTERGTNTKLAVIVTNIEMTRDELIKVSKLAQDGMARVIYPVHTNWDGDVIFSISPHCKNRIKLNLNSFDLVNYVGIVASDILIEAINNGIKNAKGIGGFPSYEDLKRVGVL